MGERRCVSAGCAHCHDNLAHMGRADDETVIHVPSNLDDTIISAPDDSTVTSVPDDATVTPEYNTLISAMLDNSVVDAPACDETVAGVDAVEDLTVVGADDTIIMIDEVTRGTLSGGIQLAGDISDTAPIEGDPGDTAPIVRFQLRENNGTKHALGRPIVVGRLPRAPRTGRGAVELLVVPSPNGQVSSTHAMIEALGDVVVVTDLRSTNGTRVNNAGRPSVLLAPGDSLTVGAGAVIDVGDGNRLEVLSLS
jgi:hypothetical protein